MFTVYFLVIVLQKVNPTIEHIPQANKEQCEINAKAINTGNIELSSGDAYQKANCIVGVLSK